MTIGEHLAAGRKWAMDFARTKQPVGASYNWAFHTWLLRFMGELADKKLKNTRPIFSTS